MIRGHDHVGDENAPCKRCGWLREAHPSPDEPRQERLFNPDRFSPVTLAAWLRLPKSIAREFAVASCIGKALAADGTFRVVRKPERYVAVVVQRAQRKAILRVAGVSPNYWHKLVSRWHERGVAHACDRDNTCLFVHPDEPICPFCKAESGTPQSRSGGVTETENRDSTVTVAGLHSHGSGTPQSRTEHESGDDYGIERGMGLDSASSSLSSSVLVREEAFKIAAPPLRENGEELPCWHRTSTDKQRVCGDCQRLRAYTPDVGLLDLKEERIER